jgi:hypothetical protein
MEGLAPANVTQGMEMLEEAVRIYNEERLHMSIDLQVPAKAHELDHRLPRRWKSYYAHVNLEQDQPEIATLTQDQHL